jgi:hypothetical protein
MTTAWLLDKIIGADKPGYRTIVAVIEPMIKDTVSTIEKMISQSGISASFGKEKKRRAHRASMRAFV